MLLLALLPLACKGPSATIPPAEAPVASAEAPPPGETPAPVPAPEPATAETSEDEARPAGAPYGREYIDNPSAPSDVDDDVDPEAYGVGGLGRPGGTGEGSAGVGTIGTIGKGSASGGGSSGHTGGGFGGRGKKVPTVRQAKAIVTGDLDKDIVRRIVRAHINEVRACYDKVLAQDPTAGGKVTIDFTIAGDGKVTLADVASSTFSGNEPGLCIANAVKRWTFPRPQDGGTVQVTYPFNMTPGE